MISQSLPPYLTSSLDLVRCQPVSRALFRLPGVIALVNLRHGTLLLLPVLLSFVSGKLQIMGNYNLINAKAVESSEGLVEDYGGLVKGYGGLKIASQPVSDAAPGTSSGGLLSKQCIIPDFLL